MPFPVCSESAPGDERRGHFMRKVPQIIARKCAFSLAGLAKRPAVASKSMTGQSCFGWISSIATPGNAGQLILVREVVVNLAGESLRDCMPQTLGQMFGRGRQP
jgi:hypothetical protein